MRAKGEGESNKNDAEMSTVDRAAVSDIDTDGHSALLGTLLFLVHVLGL